MDRACELDAGLLPAVQELDLQHSNPLACRSVLGELFATQARLLAPVDKFCLRQL